MDGKVPLVVMKPCVPRVWSHDLLLPPIPHIKKPRTQVPRVPRVRSHFLSPPAMPDIVVGFPKSQRSARGPQKRGLVWRCAKFIPPPPYLPQQTAQSKESNSLPQQTAAPPKESNALPQQPEQVFDIKITLRSRRHHQHAMEELQFITSDSATQRDVPSRCFLHTLLGSH